MPLRSPILDDRSYAAAARRAGRPDPGLRAGVDRPQPERPGHHADRAVRVPRREPAVPLQPDPGRHQAGVPAAAGHPAARRPCRRPARPRSPPRVAAGVLVPADTRVLAGHGAVPDRLRAGRLAAGRAGRDPRPVRRRAGRGHRRVLRPGERRRRDHGRRPRPATGPCSARPRRSSPAVTYWTRPGPSTAGCTSLLTVAATSRRTRSKFAGGLVTLGVMPRPRGRLDVRRGRLRRRPPTRPADAVADRDDAPRCRARRDPDSADPVWRTLAVEADTTAALTRPGVVRLRLPDDLTDIGVYLPADPDAAGAGDQPPLIEDDDARRYARCLAAGVPAGRRARCRAVDWVGANAAPVRAVGRGDRGVPRHGHRRARPGVPAGAPGRARRRSRWRSRSRAPAAGCRGRRSTTSAAAGVDDRVFVVDPEAGVVRFGDGRRGRPPQIGERIRVTPLPLRRRGRRQRGAGRDHDRPVGRRRHGDQPAARRGRRGRRAARRGRRPDPRRAPPARPGGHRLGLPGARRADARRRGRPGRDAAAVQPAPAGRGVARRRHRGGLAGRGHGAPGCADARPRTRCGRSAAGWTRAGWSPPSCT